MRSYDPQDVPRCPGCHFCCQLDYCQCGRGARLLDSWLAGEPLPERRMPRPARPKRSASAAERVPSDFGLMRAITLAGAMCAPDADDDPPCKVLGALLAHEEYASFFVIRERTRMADDEVSDAIGQLANEGLVEYRYEYSGDLFAWLTPMGVQAARDARVEAQQRGAELLSAFDDDEKMQLKRLLDKLIEKKLSM